MAPGSRLSDYVHTETRRCLNNANNSNYYGSKPV